MAYHILHCGENERHYSHSHSGGVLRNPMLFQNAMRANKGPSPKALCFHCLMLYRVELDLKLNQNSYLIPLPEFVACHPCPKATPLGR